MGYASSDLYGNRSDWSQSQHYSENCSLCAPEVAHLDDEGLGQIPLYILHCSRCKALDVVHEAQAYLCPSKTSPEAVHGQRKYHSALAKESGTLGASASWDIQILDDCRTCQTVEVHHQPYASHVVAHVPGSSSLLQIGVSEAAAQEEQTSWNMSDCLCVCPEVELLWSRTACH